MVLRFGTAGVDVEVASGVILRCLDFTSAVAPSVQFTYTKNTAGPGPAVYWSDDGGELWTEAWTAPTAATNDCIAVCVALDELAGGHFGLVLVSASRLDPDFMTIDDLAITPDAACPTTPVADLTGDGVVDAGDLAFLLAGWGTCPPPEFASCPADLTGDGGVDAADLAVLLASWGAGSG